MAFCGSISGEISEFHRLSEDIHRSSVPIREFGALGSSHFASTFETSSGFDKHREMRPAETHAWFQASAVAPELPQDELFHLVCTNIRSSRRAGELGNCLLEFLDTEVTCRVTKVEPDKLCIKFAIDAQGFCTEVKVRIYSIWGSIEHMVEFQKCSGDATVFFSIFQRMRKLLQHWEVLPERSELVLLPELKFVNIDAAAFGFHAMERVDTDDASLPQPNCFNHDMELLSFEPGPPADHDACHVCPRTRYWGPLQV
jgi:hypothetical protein